METFVLGFEVSAGTPVFKLYRQAVYRHTRGTEHALEEAIANYVARERVCQLVDGWVRHRGWKKEHVDIVLGFIDDLYERSPPGYRHWYLAVKPMTWRRLAVQAISGDAEPQEPLRPLEPALQSLPDGLIELPQVPVRIVAEDALADRFTSSTHRPCRLGPRG